MQLAETALKPGTQPSRAKTALSTIAAANPLISGYLLRSGAQQEDFFV
jgi:hypothetical protein